MTTSSNRAYKLQEFVAHSSGVNCLKLGRKTSQVLATGGGDHNVNIWAIGKPNAKFSLLGHTSVVKSVSFDSSEALVAAGAASGAIKLWDLEEAKIVRTLTGHRLNCMSVEFHPFGEYFMSASLDTNIKIWDLRKKGCIHTYKGHTRGVNAVRFTPDGRWAVSGGKDNTVKVWDLTAGKLLHEFKSHEGQIQCIDFHPLEFLMATGSADRTVKFWDLETFELVASTGPEETDVQSMTFNTDGSSMLCGLRGSLKVFSWEPVRCHDTVYVGWSGLSDLNVHEGKLLGCSSNQNDVVIWVVDLTSLEPYTTGTSTKLNGLSELKIKSSGTMPLLEDSIEETTLISTCITPQAAACSTVARYRMDQIVPEGSQEPTNLPLVLLKDITDNFSEERQIGSGGFAVVYKGVLQDGIVAVKRLLNSHTIDERTFYRETGFLMSIKHQNIVQFLGFCASTENQVMKLEGKYIYPELRERLLCFEYMSNGSLRNHLTDELRGLDWQTRYQIIKGICEGLHYLNKEMSIIHRDLKPENILLDALMVPKIADFGISKLLEGVTHATTSDRVMSLGYCPPEYVRFGKLTLKLDVYSLGVIIMELVTGRREDPDINNVLRRWRYRWNKSGNHTPIGYGQAVQKCIDVAVRCIAENPKQRPYIWDVIRDLNEMESTTGHINNANESTVGQINPYPWELLGIEPLELHFPFELNKQVSCSLKLTNERDDHIAFRINMMSHLQYCIEPTKGVVPPLSKCTVSITLQAREKAPPSQGGMMCKDELVVWSTVVNEGLTAEDVTEDMFSGEGGKEVDEVNLAIVFDATSLP